MGQGQVPMGQGLPIGPGQVAQGPVLDNQGMMTPGDLNAKRASEMEEEGPLKRPKLTLPGGGAPLQLDADQLARLGQ